MRRIVATALLFLFIASLIGCGTNANGTKVEHLLEYESMANIELLENFVIDNELADSVWQLELTHWNVFLIFNDDGTGAEHQHSIRTFAWTAENGYLFLQGEFSGSYSYTITDSDSGRMLTLTGLDSGITNRFFCVATSYERCCCVRIARDYFFGALSEEDAQRVLASAEAEQGNSILNTECGKYNLATSLPVEQSNINVLDFIFTQSISDDMPPFTFRMLGEISWSYGFHGQLVREIVIESIHIIDVYGDKLQIIDNLVTTQGWRNEENLFGLSFADYNFDGYLDMRLWRHGTGNRQSGAHYFWLWNNEKGQYVLSPELISFSNYCSIMIDEDLQRLSVFHGWRDGGITTFAEFIDGVLVITDVESAYTGF